MLRTGFAREAPFRTARGVARLLGERPAHTRRRFVSFDFDFDFNFNFNFDFNFSFDRNAQTL